MKSEKNHVAPFLASGVPHASELDEYLDLLPWTTTLEDTL